MIQRDGNVVMRMLENIQQKTIQPIIEAFIAPSTMVYTDEYGEKSYADSFQRDTTIES